MENMSFTDYIAAQELYHNRSEGWTKASPIWVIAAVLIILAIVYSWNKNCNEKVNFATGLANLDGRINCLAPQVATLNSQMYGAAQAFAGLTVGVNDIKDNYGMQLAQLNNSVFYNPINSGSFSKQCGCGCGTPSRVFAQTQTYTPSSQQVTVTETCGNDRC